MIFSENYSDQGERYTGVMEWSPIANVASKKMQNFVSIVAESNFEVFKVREATKHHVLLFTDKRSTPALFKALSKKYLNKLYFGEVRATSK